jgi:hypothetical protein
VDAVSDQTPPDLGLDEDTVTALAAHLEVFADTLSEHERRLLAGLLWSVLDPLERMRFRDPAELLSPQEAEILRALESERKGESTP